jgi:hypothetical protein
VVPGPPTFLDLPGPSGEEGRSGNGVPDVPGPPPGEEGSGKVGEGRGRSEVGEWGPGRSWTPPGEEGSGKVGEAPWASKVMGGVRRGRVEHDRVLGPGPAVLWRQVLAGCSPRRIAACVSSLHRPLGLTTPARTCVAARGQGPAQGAHGMPTGKRMGHRTQTVPARCVDCGLSIFPAAHSGRPGPAPTQGICNGPGRRRTDGRRHSRGPRVPRRSCPGTLAPECTAGLAGPSSSDPFSAWGPCSEAWGVRGAIWRHCVWAGVVPAGCGLRARWRAFCGDGRW